VFDPHKNPLLTVERIYDTHEEISNRNQKIRQAVFSKLHTFKPITMANSVS